MGALSKTAAPQHTRPNSVLAHDTDVAALGEAWEASVHPAVPPRTQGDLASAGSSLRSACLVLKHCHLQAVCSPAPSSPGLPSAPLLPRTPLCSPPPQGLSSSPRTSSAPLLPQDSPLLPSSPRTHLCYSPYSLLLSAPPPQDSPLFLTLPLCPSSSLRTSSAPFLPLLLQDPFLLHFCGEAHRQAVCIRGASSLSGSRRSIVAFAWPPPPTQLSWFTLSVLMPLGPLHLYLIGAGHGRKKCGPSVCPGNLQQLAGAGFVEVPSPQSRSLTPAWSPL